jgi:hypothetical protein
MRLVHGMETPAVVQIALPKQPVDNEQLDAQFPFAEHEKQAVAVEPPHGDPVAQQYEIPSHARAQFLGGGHCAPLVHGSPNGFGAGVGAGVGAGEG